MKVIARDARHWIFALDEVAVARLLGDDVDGAARDPRGPRRSNPGPRRISICSVKKVVSRMRDADVADAVDEDVVAGVEADG